MVMCVFPCVLPSQLTFHTRLSVAAIVHETENHIKTCATYGISREQLLAVPESVTNIAYTRYVLDTSAKGDLLDTRVVTAPCLIGYGVVGKRLVEATEGVDKSEGNPYWTWVREYGGEWYQGAVSTGIGECFVWNFGAELTGDCRAVGEDDVGIACLTQKVGRARQDFCSSERVGDCVLGCCDGSSDSLEIEL